MGGGGEGGGDLIPQSHSFFMTMPYPELLSPLTSIPNAVSFFNGRFHTRDGKTDG